MAIVTRLSAVFVAAVLLVQPPPYDAGGNGTSEATATAANVAARIATLVLTK